MYLSRDLQRFKDKLTRLLEIGTEMLLLNSCALLQQMIVPLNPEDADTV